MNIVHENKIKQPSASPSARRTAVIDKARAAENSGEIHHRSKELVAANTDVDPRLFERLSVKDTPTVIDNGAYLTKPAEVNEGAI